MAASWPTSVKSFTRVVNGVTKLVAALYNSAYDEIEAIQTNLTGSVVQVVNYQTGAVATGTTIMPVDDTIPQNTEGDEFLSLAITPKSTANKLCIDVTFFGFNTNNIWAIALFQDSTAGAIAAIEANTVPGVGYSPTTAFRHYMTAGTTSATTFKVRAGGGSAGTTTINGNAGARLFGGVAASSITIQEIES